MFVQPNQSDILELWEKKGLSMWREKKIAKTLKNLDCFKADSRLSNTQDSHDIGIIHHLHKEYVTKCSHRLLNFLHVWLNTPFFWETVVYISEIAKFDNLTRTRRSILPLPVSKYAIKYSPVSWADCGQTRVTRNVHVQVESGRINSKTKMSWPISCISYTFNLI